MINARHPATAIFCVLAFSILTACCITPVRASEEVADLGSPLTKLAKAADGEQAYNPDPSLSDADFLRRADPESYEFFRGYVLKVDRRDGFAVVLVCDGAGGQALLEDAGCRMGVEKPHYRNGFVPCEFTIRAKEFCAK